MDGLKPLLSNKVFSIMVETEVSRLVSKPGMDQNKKLRWALGGIAMLNNKLV